MITHEQIEKLSSQCISKIAKTISHYDQLSAGSRMAPDKICQNFGGELRQCRDLCRQAASGSDICRKRRKRRKERTVDALALGGEEGRGKLR